MKYTWWWLLIGMLLLSACSASGPAAPSPVDADAPVSSADPLAPVPPLNLEVLGALDLTEVTTELLVLESYPLQYNLVLRGMLPSPCHRLLITFNEPNAGNEIHIQVMVAVDPEMICAQVLTDFEEVVSLGSYETGATYTVWINGTQVAEFTP